MDENPRFGHFRPAMPFNGQVWIQLAQMLSQVAGMLIATDFRDGNKNTLTHRVPLPAILSLHPPKAAVSRSHRPAQPPGTELALMDFVKSLWHEPFHSLFPIASRKMRFARGFRRE